MGSHGNALAVSFFRRRARLRSLAHDFHYSIEKRCGKLGRYVSSAKKIAGTNNMFWKNYLSFRAKIYGEPCRRGGETSSHRCLNKGEDPCFPPQKCLLNFGIFSKIDRWARRLTTLLFASSNNFWGNLFWLGLKFVRLNAKKRKEK